MKLKSIILLSCIISTTNLVTVYAQPQTTNIDLLPTYNIEVPTILEFPETFVNDTQDTLIFKAFNPGNANDIIKIYDYRNSGGFNVSVTATDFASTSDTIPFSNLELVTIANAHSPDTVDIPTGITNIPPGTDSGTVFAAYDCDWDNITPFNQACSSHFTPFSGAGVVSDPITIINGDFPTSGARMGQYSVSIGLKLLVPAGTTPGNYSSTITFSLNLI